MEWSANSAQRRLITAPGEWIASHAYLNRRGVDYVFDGVGGANIGLSIGAARRGGTVVGYGFMALRGTTATLNCYRGKFPALDTFTPFARHLELLR